MKHFYIYHEWNEKQICFGKYLQCVSLFSTINNASVNHPAVLMTKMQMKIWITKKFLASIWHMSLKDLLCSINGNLMSRHLLEVEWNETGLSEGQRDDKEHNSRHRFDSKTQKLYDEEMISWYMEIFSCNVIYISIFQIVKM